MITTSNGRAEGTPGVNLDRIDVEAGVVMARRIGYSSRNEIMLVEYCLSRWAKGEEHLAESTAIHMGIDLTSWRMILAEAMSVATQIAAIRNRN